MGEISFNKFVTRNIEYVEKDDRRTFSGHISAEIIDKQNEFIAQTEILKTMDNWLRFGASISDSHSNRIIGKGLSYEKSEYEGHPTVKIEAEIYNGYELHNKVWDKIKSSEYKGLSIGGGTLTGREPIVKDGKMAYALKDLEIYEVAVCKNPANPLAIIDNVNEIAKSYDVSTHLVGERNIIQCDSINCVIKTPESTPEVELAKLILEKESVGIGGRIVSNEQLYNQNPSENSYKESKNKKENAIDTIKYINSNETMTNMSETEAINNPSNSVEKEETHTAAPKKPEQPKAEVPVQDSQKSDTNTETILKLLTDSITNQNKTIEKLSATVDELAKNNPVNDGKKLETPQNTNSSKDSGIPIRATNDYQGKSEQSGINHTEEHPAVPEKSKLRMENKEDDEKTEDKENKMEDEKKPEMMDKKKEEVEIRPTLKTDTGYAYTTKQTPRPGGIIDPQILKSQPDGYQILKAVEQGWGHTHDMTESLREMNVRFRNGEFTGGRVQ